MTDATTKKIEISILYEDYLDLLAFTQARNGDINNQASAAIRWGVSQMVSVAPDVFQQRYREARAALKGT